MFILDGAPLVEPKDSRRAGNEYGKNNRYRKISINIECDLLYRVTIYEWGS